MIAAVVALLAASLPEGSARYRVEIGGAHVGVAELSVGCAGEEGCRLTWSSTLRLPAASGGQVVEQRVEAVLDREGRGAGEVALERDGVRRAAQLPPGAAPASAAELLLWARGGGCVAVADEEGGAAGAACATIDGRTLRATVLGVPEVVTVADDGFPGRVEIPGQRTRYVREPGARVPAAAPPLEVRVAGPAAADAAHRFCGLAPDRPAPRAALTALPRPRPDGRSCRDQAASYVAAAERAGLPARVALGVAHDGQGFVWHAWAEVETPAGWVAVDPAFGQLPARGPRFTVARHGGDPAGREAAGRRILACWGTAAVEENDASRSRARLR
ncbi:MAG TPA: transglutaminase family protein [Anaeromyxobacter sp.]|nr:transglutaminase family protein [Anaeromyxobacter sp.]